MASIEHDDQFEQSLFTVYNEFREKITRLQESRFPKLDEFARLDTATVCRTKHDKVHPSPLDHAESQSTKKKRTRLQKVNKFSADIHGLTKAIAADWLEYCDQMVHLVRHTYQSLMHLIQERTRDQHRSTAALDYNQIAAYVNYAATILQTTQSNAKRDRDSVLRIFSTTMLIQIHLLHGRNPRMMPLDWREILDIDMWYLFPVLAYLHAVLRDAGAEHTFTTFVLETARDQVPNPYSFPILLCAFLATPQLSRTDAEAPVRIRRVSVPTVAKDLPRIACEFSEPALRARLNDNQVLYKVFLLMAISTWASAREELANGADTDMDIAVAMSFLRGVFVSQFPLLFFGAQGSVDKYDRAGPCTDR